MFILLFVLVFALIISWQGYALTVLVAWFLVPAFGMAPLGIVTAIGMCLICRLMTSKITDKGATGSHLYVLVIMIQNGVLIPAFALGFGWIFKSII